MKRDLPRGAANLRLQRRARQVESSVRLSRCATAAGGQSRLCILPAPSGTLFSMRTYVATPATRERNWLVVDASGQTLGRLATQIADVLRGKRKPEYTPHCDVGDFVVVINAEKITVTGKKREEKRY